MGLKRGLAVFGLLPALEFFRGGLALDLALVRVTEGDEGLLFLGEPLVLPFRLQFPPTLSLRLTMSETL